MSAGVGAAVSAGRAHAAPARRRFERRALFLLAHPQSVSSVWGRALVVTTCLSILGGVLLGEATALQNVTFGGFSLLAVLAATWLVPAWGYVPVMLAALALPVVTAALGGVDPLTAKFQFSATTVACVLTVLTVRALKANEASRQRAHDSLMRFTADAAHELRSPLTLMRATLEHLTRQQRSAAEYADRTQTVLREVDRLIHVSNALLVLAQSDAGLLALGLERVDLGDLLDELEARWAPSAAAAGVTLSHAVARGASARCDPGLVGRLLDNLVENAIRHTPRGGSVTVRVAADGAEEWDIEVRDTGTGIPVAFRRRLFERFSRAEEGRERSTGGAGLGLSVCAAIAAAHGGSVELVETDATGTTIVLHLPVTPSSG